MGRKKALLAHIRRDDSHCDRIHLENEMMEAEPLYPRTEDLPEVVDLRLSRISKMSWCITIFNIGVLIVSIIILGMASAMRTMDDQAHWKATSQYCNESDVRALGKDPAIAVKVPESLGHGPDAYIAQTEVFHHLHCLDMLRKEISYAHYYASTEGPSPGGAQHVAHIGHCIDVLAQALKCTGSVDMITFNWVEEWSQPFPDFSNHKVCRDFDSLHEWVTRNSMDPFQKMTSPSPGQIVLPAPGLA
ncbi:hypothetical protein SCUP234_11649 [Seiridium cupressi]